MDLFLNNRPDALIIQIYSVTKLYVSGIFSAHHQEIYTVHSALVSFMQVFDDRFQAESGWNCSSILPDFHEIRHMKVVRSSSSPTGRLYPQEIFLVLIFTVDRVV